MNLFLTITILFLGFDIGLVVGAWLTARRAGLGKTFWDRQWALFACKLGSHAWKFMPSSSLPHRKVSQCMTCGMWHVEKFKVFAPKNPLAKSHE